MRKWGFHRTDELNMKTAGQKNQKQIDRSALSQTDFILLSVEKFDLNLNKK